MHFDPSYFTDNTGKFRFPAYTLNWTGLVQIRDLTDYKKECFYGLSDEAIRSFSLHDFESAKLTAKFAVESLLNFVNRFPESSFNKGISKSVFCSLLELYSPFDSDFTKEEDRHKVHFEPREIKGADVVGIMKQMDISADPEKFWAGLPKARLSNICIANNIRPQTNKKYNIQQLIANHVPFPEIVAIPTPLFKDVYLNFADLYIQSIQQSTIHFHPRLLKDLWAAVSNANERTPIVLKVKQLLKSSYWLNGSLPAINYDSWSNNVFTFLPPLPATDPLFAKKYKDPNDAPDKPWYLKAKEGTFDRTVFTREGEFCFPDYSDASTGMVYVGDMTNYKKVYGANYSLDKMERNFVTPEWEFQELEAFIEDLPATYMKEGISGLRLRDIISNHYYYLNSNEEDTGNYELLSENDPLVKNGFFEAIDQADFNAASSWNTMPEEALAATCKENNIKPAKQKVAMIWQLIDNNVPFPLKWYKPTPALIEYYRTFIELYITDIQQGTNHFHPLYFQSMWEELKELHYTAELNERINAILANPYWEDRLYIALL